MKRYQWLDFGQEIEDAYQLKLEKKHKESLKKLREASQEEIKKVEKEGVCQGCGKSGLKCRWCRDKEFYLCYDCFYHDLDCEASVMVPIHNATELKDFIEEDIWDCYWEIENGIYIPF
jgi:hypothetical protein